ncbi:MAG: TolC family protein [Saprospiraceae bacterium]|nr:TolC family protein [Saprospiraceae bacterium]
MGKKSFWIWIIFLGFATLAPAQSMDSLVRQALAENLLLAASEKEYRAALEEAPQVSQLPDPEFGLGVFIMPVETRVGAQEMRLAGTQMFPWPGTLRAKRDLAISAAEIEGEQRSVIRLEIAYRARKAFLELYLLQERAVIVDRNLDLLRSLEQLSLSKVESGRASTADVLRVKLQIREQEQRLKTLENSLRKPLAELNQLLNRSPDTEISVEGRLSVADLPEGLESIREFLEEGHPSLRVLEARQEKGRRALALNELDRKPSFGAGLDYVIVSRRNDASPPDDGRNALMPRATVKVPLFTSKFDARAEQERLRIQALEDRKLNLGNELIASLQQALADHRDAELKLELYRDQLVTLNRAIEVLTEKYSNQGSSFDELLRLYQERIGYDMKRLEAIVQSHLARAAVLRLIDF